LKKLGKNSARRKVSGANSIGRRQSNRKKHDNTKQTGRKLLATTQKRANEGNGEEGGGSDGYVGNLYNRRKSEFKPSEIIEA